MSQVRLLVYDLSQGMARQFSAALLGKQIDGIWHTGVLVFGREVYFGGGICSCLEEESPYGKPIQIHDMGTTDKTEAQFLSFLTSISHRFTMYTYNLLENNCNNFSDEVCQYLVGKKIPSYITDLPREAMSTPFGAMLRPVLDQMQSQIRAIGAEQAMNLDAPKPSYTANGSSSALAPSLEADANSPITHEISAHVLVNSVGSSDDKVKSKLKEFSPSTDPSSIPSLLASLNTTAPDKVFPALDLLSRRASESHIDNARIRAVVHDKILRPYVLHEQASRPVMLMALRVAVALCALEEGTRGLVASDDDAAVTVESIAVGLNADHPTVHVAAAALAQNVTGAVFRHNKRVRLCEDAALRLTHVLCDSITQHGHRFCDGDSVVIKHLLGALLCLIVADDQCEQLAQALDFSLPQKIPTDPQSQTIIASLRTLLNL